MPRPSKRASPMAVWTPTLQALLDACPRFPPRLHRAAAAADAFDPIVDSLYRCGWFDQDPHAPTRVRLALQDLRLERLCGYYTPDSTPEVFELALRWTTILWLVDDTLARASSPAALSEAIRDHRRFILPALRGFLVQGAPPLARFIAQHAHRFARVAPRATLVGFQRSAERWLERGTLALATYAMAGLTPTLAAQESMRRWDGGADASIHHLQLCWPSIAPFCAGGGRALPAIEHLHRVAATHAALMSDVLAYEREFVRVRERHGCLARANIVRSVAARRGCSESHALHVVLRRLRALTEEFTMRVEDLARDFEGCEGTTRSSLLAYAEALGRLMHAPVLWSMEGGRPRSTTEATTRSLGAIDPRSPHLVWLHGGPPG